MSGVLSALQLVCGAGAQMGPVSRWSGERNMLMMALQRAEDWMWAIVFKLPGDFGVLHFKDYSVLEVKSHYLLKIRPISAFTMYRPQISCVF